VVVEVAALARSFGAVKGIRRRTVVDLRRMRQQMPERPNQTTLVVGHLSHLLPVQRVILLRCHPNELRRRLRRRRGLSSRQREENVISEAIDLIRWEIEERRLPVVELDTSGRSPAQVAGVLRVALSRRGPHLASHIDWLSDPTVTEELLRRAP
jgi:adenylate kinase